MKTLAIVLIALLFALYSFSPAYGHDTIMVYRSYSFIPPRVIVAVPSYHPPVLGYPTPEGYNYRIHTRYRHGLFGLRGYTDVWEYGQLPAPQISR